MILPIIKYPNERLNVRCKSIKKVTEALRDFGKNLLDTLKYENALGLAAPQVGELIKVIAIRINSKNILMYNPVIMQYSPIRRKYREECLSFEKKEGYSLKRSIKVKVKYLDINNKIKMIELKDMEAVCVQHEIDHLLGITMNINGIKL